VTHKDLTLTYQLPDTSPTLGGNNGTMHIWDAVAGFAEAKSLEDDVFEQMSVR
jgi:hypothetical protein